MPTFDLDLPDDDRDDAAADFVCRLAGALRDVELLAPEDAAGLAP